MKDSLDLSKYSIRTDLAVEAREMAIAERAKTVQNEENLSQIEGVIIKEKEEDGMKISIVEITKQAEEAIGKKQGRYLTIEVAGIRQQDSELQQKVAKVFAQEFAHFLKMLGISETASCLVVGLGNWNVTPDALGPSVCENLLVTRHLFQLQPENVEEGFRPVSAFAPGVMGITGIETSDIILGVVEKQSLTLSLPLMRSPQDQSSGSIRRFKFLIRAFTLDQVLVISAKKLVKRHWVFRLLL